MRSAPPAAKKRALTGAVLWKAPVGVFYEVVGAVEVCLPSRHHQRDQHPGGVVWERRQGVHFGVVALRQDMEGIVPAVYGCGCSVAVVGNWRQAACLTTATVPANWSP